MKKISVIIPMYNSEAYIKQCIHSVTSQTYQNLEILVIDDGSTDRGVEVCQELAREDERIRLYTQENGGVSKARNYGLKVATGEYIFFLDSDDAVHPLLFEEYACEMEERGAELLFCSYKKLDTQQMESVLEEISERDTRPLWKIAEGTETEEWFHKKYSNEMSGIGGKMVCKDLVRDLRFDENLANGEDTLFVYHLICRQIRTAYAVCGWYYYRMHQGSVTKSLAMVMGKRYFECSRMLRDSEYQKGHIEYATKWEGFTVNQIQRSLLSLRNNKDRKWSNALKKIAISERKHPLFKSIHYSGRILFVCCIYCFPMYYLLSKLIPVSWKLREMITMKNRNAHVGILTFHCSNNYGAMLQAYGLKTFLGNSGIQADIIRYEPPYMTGRHWWIPYVPFRGTQGRKWCRSNMWRGFKAHLKMGKDFSLQRKNMSRFRKQYLIDKDQDRLLFTSRFRWLPYRYYIVGSDQIWNPNITCGLRRAYFGAFKNKKKERVISYAASLGGADLSPQYNEEFANLISYLDAVSVREEAAIPYIKQYYNGEVTSVLDPVFLLDKDAWQSVEKEPGQDRYILVYITEKNQMLTDYVVKLSQDTGLPVIEVKFGQLSTKADFQIDVAAGPAEFLGYIHKAVYIVTNSFHAVAFSIIYQKKFLAFLHSNLGARIRNIIAIHGLEDRLYCSDKETSIDACIDWDEVKKKTGENVKLSGDYLLKNIFGHEENI